MPKAAKRPRAIQVILETATETVDGRGNSVPAWNEHSRPYVTFTPDSGPQEAREDGGVEQVVRGDYSMWFRPIDSSKFRFRDSFDGAVYDVESVVNVGNHNREISGRYTRTIGADARA